MSGSVVSINYERTVSQNSLVVVLDSHCGYIYQTQHEVGWYTMHPVLLCKGEGCLYVGTALVTGAV